MAKLHSDPSTLSYQGRVSLSSEILPQACQDAACQLLEDCLPGCRLTDEEIAQFLNAMSAYYHQGLSESAFMLHARAAIYAWGQRFLAEKLQQNHAVRTHIRSTLSRCLPSQVITDDLVTRCEQEIRSARSPWDVGHIFRFTARELLSDPAGAPPLMGRLHASALRLLPRPDDVTRDDLRLIVLDALYDPAHPPAISVPEYLSYRLGLHGGERLSMEAIAAATRLPVLYLREIEEATLQYLIKSYHTEEPHA